MIAATLFLNWGIAVWACTKLECCVPFVDTVCAATRVFGFAAREAHFLSTLTLDHSLAWALRFPDDVLTIRSTAPLQVLVLANNDVLFHSHIPFDLALAAEFTHVKDSIIQRASLLHAFHVLNFSIRQMLLKLFSDAFRAESV